jgi:hypothetical protein
MCTCGRLSCDDWFNNQLTKFKPSSYTTHVFCAHCLHLNTSLTDLLNQYSSRPICSLHDYTRIEQTVCNSYLLGLLAKIKCSICSYQLNLWYGRHLPPFKINLIFVPCGGSLDLFSPPASGLDIAHTRRVLLVLRYHPNQLIQTIQWWSAYNLSPPLSW